MNSLFKLQLLIKSLFGWRRKNSMSRAQIIKLLKVQIHEHLDCSVRRYTLLDLMDKSGRFPESMPPHVLALWYGKNVDCNLPPEQYEAARQASREEAADVYGEWISSSARQSLKNYLDAIGQHILPVMQTSENLYRITKERLEDAIKDGIVAMELRFAPQLHTRGVPGMETKSPSDDGASAPLTLDQVMAAVIQAINESPIPIKLCICALRHENGATAQELADLAIKYREYVGVFDLAGGEASNPGVLDWWLPEALRVRRVAGIKLTCHLWETNKPTEDDLRKLEENDIDRLGHGVRGSKQGSRWLECCPTSNVVTGQYKSLRKHPINKLFRRKKKVTVNTDGLTFCFTVPEGLSEEYFNLQEVFDWGLQEFYVVNVNAVLASCFAPDVQESLLERLRICYYTANVNAVRASGFAPHVQERLLRRLRIFYFGK